MSFINPITDFEIALDKLEPNIAKAIREQVPTQLEFEDYWRKMLRYIQRQIEMDTSLDITPFQKTFLVTLLTNCGDNATINGDEYKEIKSDC